MDKMIEGSVLSEQVLDNLRQNSRELNEKFAKRHLHMRDLARTCSQNSERASGAALPESLVDAFNSYREFCEQTDEALPTADNRFDKGCFQLTKTLSDTVFCKEAGEMLNLAESVDKMKLDGARICYFRNHFSDRAFLDFASYLPDASADYTHDFASACEGVYYGKYDYCILPSESYTDGQMIRILSLMQKYELYIALSCRIYSESSDEFISFYLLSASLCLPEKADRMAVTVIPDSSCPLWQILSGAEILGAPCIECTSLPEKTYSEKAYFTVFDIANSDPHALISYLQLKLNAYTMGGIYREI